MNNAPRTLRTAAPTPQKRRQWMPVHTRDGIRERRLETSRFGDGLETGPRETMWWRTAAPGGCVQSGPVPAWSRRHRVDRHQGGIAVVPRPADVPTDPDA